MLTPCLTGLGTTHQPHTHTRNPKALHIPDELRGVMTNLFRIPLNVLVVTTLLYVGR